MTGVRAHPRKGTRGVRAFERREPRSVYIYDETGLPEAPPTWMVEEEMLREAGRSAPHIGRRRRGNRKPWQRFVR